MTESVNYSDDFYHSFASAHVLRAYKLFKKLYVGNSTEEIRKRLGFHSFYSLAYGDIEFHSFLDILSLSKPTQGDKFLDIGSGTGKTLVASELVYGALFSLICGIEISEKLVGVSKEILGNYMKICEENNIQDYKLPNSKFAVFHGDIVEHKDIIIDKGDFEISLNPDNASNNENEIRIVLSR